MRGTPGIGILRGRKFWKLFPAGLSRMKCRSKGMYAMVPGTHINCFFVIPGAGPFRKQVKKNNLHPEDCDREKGKQR